ncbi:sodium/hydrogen exchanger 3 isoform X2 [Anthonomus grandis grandis]|uniref:sodium/hydrogen exchanger 3 isoform X2 n=1 Tax=Anthonomus grandis grandis TaxID=2921223 RepID=UPI002165A059|nr:sodium/hydrogen exchanger 3 isoform X2 [Anthonomus grandis grandis]
MYSLQHGVNLSRRACRHLHPLLVYCALVLVVAVGTHVVPPDHASDSSQVLKPPPDTRGAYERAYDINSLARGNLIPTPPLPPPPRPTVNRVNEVPTVEPTRFPEVLGGAGEVQKEEKKVERYPVISVSFHRVETPFIIGLWIFCASLAKIGFHMAPKLSAMFPESCLLIFVGVAIGVVLVHITDSVHMSPLTPDTFFLYMLPPIILDAGYFMPNRLFFDHLGTILLFAVIGTISNTLLIGASLWAVGLTGLFSCDTPLLDMFLFGSLISAVDPVAVLAVFEEIQVNEILYIVVFGESLLNDAVTVVLYHLFESYTEMGLRNIVPYDLVSGFLNFLVVAIGGTVIGVIWGFATALVTRFTNEVRVIEPIFIFVMAYLAYLNAEVFHMSGILAITFCGITMKNYVESNISHKSHTTIKYAMKMLSSSSETIIFMFLGVATVNKNHDWNTWFVLLTILFCSLYRVIGVIVLTAIANRFRLHQLSKVEKFVMSYGGLRGAVAFALVLLIDPKIVPLQPMFMTTTIAVVYFTVFFQGITIKPLVKILNVKTAEKRKPTMNERIHERLMDHAMAAIEDIVGQHGNYHIRDRFKRFDNKFIRPYLLRNHQGAEPKILETYSKLAMRDAMEYMRRNASTIGNISNTESMSAIFRNYTPTGNLNGSSSLSQIDSSTWNIDMQELDYNPSKKDLTDAKIHHLLAEELVKPYRRVSHRRLSYSRHAVNDRDLSTQVNYRMHVNMRRLVADKKHHHSHKRHSKKLNKNQKNSLQIPGRTSRRRSSSGIYKSGKENHVSFPEFQQNGTAKQFSHDYISEVLNEDADITEPRSNREEWDSPITFTAKSSPSTGAEEEEEEVQENSPLPKTKPSALECTLPWRRERNVTDDSIFSDTGKRLSRGSIDGGDLMRVSTPTATEMMLPWKREEEEGCGPLPQAEFPSWASNKEYLAYNSPSATFLGGLENPNKNSIFGLFRRESLGSDPTNSNESTPLRERRGSVSRTSTILVEEGECDPLGVIQRETVAPPPVLPPPPQTPGQRRHHQPRRGSMLELSGSLQRDSIPEERNPPHQTSSLKRPTWLLQQQQPPGGRRASFSRQNTLGAALMDTVSSPSSGTSTSSDEDEELLMKGAPF